MVVVLPEPLTPVMRMTKGFFSISGVRGMATGVRIWAISVARASRISVSVTSLPKRVFRKLAMMRAATVAPRSAAMSMSSSSSRASSSSLRLVKPAVMPVVSFSVLRERPDFSLEKKAVRAIRLCR